MAHDGIIICFCYLNISGISQLTIPNVDTGLLPVKMKIGFVRCEAYGGDYNHNPVKKNLYFVSIYRNKTIFYCSFYSDIVI